MSQFQLKEYLRSNHITQSEFSRRHRISQPYINQIVTGVRKPGKKISILIEKVTEGFVKKSQLRPDIWS